MFWMPDWIVGCEAQSSKDCCIFASPRFVDFVTASDSSKVSSFSRTMISDAGLVSGNSVGDSRRATGQGHLMKQSKYFSRWKPRYFRLEDGFLTYYDKKSLVGTHKNKVR